MSVVQVFLVLPRDLLPSIFPSISCSCDELCLIRCPRYCNFLVLNCLTISDQSHDIVFMKPDRVNNLDIVGFKFILFDILSVDS